MARRYGKMNRYRSRLRRCAISGLRGYENEMIHKNGLYYIPRWLDEDTRRRRGGGLGALVASGANIIYPWGSSTPSATPSATPSHTPSPSATASATPSATSSASPSISFGSGTFYPAVSGDDGYYYVKFSFFDTSGDAIYFGGAWGASSDHAFIRFTGVNIPQGATITTAYIIFESQYGSSGTVCNVNIYFENADSPAAPVDWADMNGRSKTAAVAWNNVGDWTASSYYNSPELSSILQTVVDRPGFGETVVIAYIYDNGSSDSADRNARSIEPVLAGGSGNAPGLYVEWTY